MIVELARLALGLIIVLFHRPIANFILNRDRELVNMLSQRGFYLPCLPSSKFTHDLYFCIGIFVAMFSLARLWLAL